MAPKSKKSIFYIDGQNFHKRLEACCKRILMKSCLKKAENELKNSKDPFTERDIELLAAKKFEKRKNKEVLDSRYVDFKKLCETIREEINAPEIEAIKYYGARYPSEIDLGKHNLDGAYFRQLENDGITFREGKFLWDKENFEKFGGTPRNLREKGVDVKLAVDLVVDASAGLFTHAFVLSQDTDLAPAYEHILEKTRRKIHTRTIDSFKGLDKLVDTNQVILVKTVITAYNYKRAASTDSMQALAERFKKK